jgi:shikimate kinase
VRQRLLFLIGYRGAGKTEVARLLAPMLGWNWLDADAVLEERQGRSICEIFAEEGETGFRAKGAALLQELCGLQDHVIATGGGVILREENRAGLKRGAVVWLCAPAAVLWQRIQADATTAQRRPDLGQGGMAEIAEMLRLREPLYQACQDLMVDASKKTPQHIADTIAAWIAESA